MEKSDNRIVELVINGEAEAYSELIQRYHKRIYNLMYRFCFSRSEASDLTQEVFCKAYEKLNSYDNGKQFFSWLYTLAMNHGRDWARMQQRKRSCLNSFRLEMTAEKTSFPHQAVEKKQEIERMLMALGELPYDKREILILRYQQDLSLREIADIFHLTTGAVKMRINRALSLLQSCFGEEKNFDD